MRRIYLLGAVTILAAGCAPTLDDIDVSKKEPTCARQCTTTYSDCVARALAPGNFRSCKEALRLCVQTCPDK